MIISVENKIAYAVTKTMFLDSVEEEKGFYFFDEMGYFRGPYPTFETAEKAKERYELFLHSTPDEKKEYDI